MSDYSSGYAQLGYFSDGSQGRAHQLLFVQSNQAVPEPLTILGAMTAAGFGTGFKRKLAKFQKDKKD
jgi:hypothetical protein